MQFNIGIQHEIRSGLVISADYLRNRGIGFLQGQDMNFVGAARFLDANIANAAVADMLAFCGATDIVSAAAVGGCANASTVTGRQGQNFADITLLADFGAGGGPAPNTGMAFGGRNRAFNNVPVYRNSGTSTFDALQLRINGRLGTFGFLKNLSTNSSYQFGELRSNGGRGNFGDQDLFNLAMNNDRPTDYFGPSNQSSRHQISVGFGMEMPMGFNFSTITTYRSPLPTSLLAPDWSSGGFENIFTSDLDGDGLINDPIPGQGRGSYGRAVSAHDLAKLMNNFNSSQVGKLTPAGQALVAAGVLSADELKALGGYIGYHGRVTCTTGPQCAANLGKLNPVGLFVPTASPFSNPHFFNSDIRISNKIRVGERYVIEPMVEIFNVLNKQNYVSFGDTSALATQGTINGRTGILGSPTFGAVNTVAAGDQVDERGVDRVGGGKIGLPGTPRAFQFGVRVSF
jgi:hypothetical protein